MDVRGSFHPRLDHLRRRVRLRTRGESVLQLLPRRVALAKEGFTARAVADLDDDGQAAIYTINIASNEMTKSRDNN